MQIPLLFSLMSFKVLESSISAVCAYTACISRKVKENIFMLFLNCLVFISLTLYHHFLRFLAVKHLANYIQTDREGSCLTLTLCSHYLGFFKLFIPISNLKYEVLFHHHILKFHEGRSAILCDTCSDFQNGFSYFEP